MNKIEPRENTAAESALPGAQKTSGSLPSGFEATFLILVLGGLILFLVLVTIYGVWKWVLIFLGAVLLSRIPLFLLFQLIMVFALMFIVGALVFA
jgi:hypothetical protein